MQKKGVASAISTEAAEADKDVGAPKFLPFVQQVHQAYAYFIAPSAPVYCLLLQAESISLHQHPGDA